VQLHPHHLPLLLHLSSCAAASPAPYNNPPAARPGGSTATAYHSRAQAGAAARSASGGSEALPGARSRIEGMLLPDTTGIATEFLSQSWGYGRGSAGRAPDDSQARRCVSFFATLFLDRPPPSLIPRKPGFSN
jgi:hypothetical protein